MESNVKLLGHPVHPMLIVFPVGLLSAAVIFDIAYVVTGNEQLAIFSYWAIVGGLTGGLLAAVFGLLDWMGIPSGTRAKRLGLTHGLGNLVVVALFALSFLLRREDPTYLPSTAPLIPGLLGVALAMVTAWIGGELVYRLRVGVDDDANLDASNSLQAEPVRVAPRQR